MNVNPPAMLVTVYPSSVVIMDEAGIDALGQNLAVACRGMPARDYYVILTRPDSPDNWILSLSKQTGMSAIVVNLVNIFIPTKIISS